MSSYAARASRRSATSGAGAGAGDGKGVQTGTSVNAARPQLHSRKHSANSAGDVFAMLGQPLGGSKAGGGGSGGAASNTSSSTTITGAGKDKDRDRSPLPRPQQPSIIEEDSSKEEISDTSGAGAGAPGLPSLRKVQTSKESSSSPSSSTPATSLPTMSTDHLGDSKSRKKRFDTFYSKPVLLSLWRSQLSVKADLEELYAAFETPEQQASHLDGPPHKYGNQRGGGHANFEEHRHGSTHERGERGAKREREGLGRLPPPSAASTSSSSALPGGLPFPNNPRRTSSSTPGSTFGQGSLSGVFQGGVLSGVVGPSRRSADTGPLSATDGQFQRAPLSARARAAGDRDKENSGSPAAPPSAGLSGWTSNRWRHLQADEDSHISSSGSSTKDENEENDPWSRPHSSGDNEWKPGQHDKIEQEKLALHKSLNGAPQDVRPGSRSLASASWRQQQNTQEPAASTGPRTVGTDGSEGPSATSDAAESGPSGKTGSTATAPTKQALFFDDLLAPTRNASGNIGQPLSVSSSRSNSIAHSMSALAIGDSSANSSRVPSGSANTPSRAAAVEGLEVLARRSPVQEMSMAALQQQRPLPGPAVATPPYSRPAPPPHPTNEPHDRIFWQYRDPQGQLQGPFSVMQMQDWYGQGFFNDTLLVKRVESTDFETLGALIIRLHDVHLPFFSAPHIKNVFVPPPPPPGLGQASFGLGQAPQRGSSPAIWDQPRPSPHAGPQDPFADVGQPRPQGSRTTSFSSGNAVFDLFSKAQIRRSESPEVTFSPSVPAQQPSALPSKAVESSFAGAPDPWADMTTKHSQPSSLRGPSGLGGEPLDTESGLFRRSQSGHHLPHIATSALRQESLPSPIGRSSSSTAVKDAANPSSSPLKQPSPELPIIGATTEIAHTSKQEAPVTGTLAQPATSSAPSAKDAATGNGAPKPFESDAATAKATNKALVSPVKAVQRLASVPSQAASGTPATHSGPAAPATPLSSQLSAKSASSAAPAPVTNNAGVGLVSQSEFEKRKKAAVSDSPVNEVTLDSLTGKDTISSISAVPKKVAPWAKSGDDYKVAEQETSLPKSASGLSLRDIQAKEQKEAEARRAREKKALAAQLAAEEAALAERRAKEAAEGLPLSARWGEAPASSPTVSTPGASSPWAKAAPALASKVSGGKAASGKKTLKEIQEEEEARSRAAAKAQSAQAMKLSKGYSSSVGHAAPSFSAPSDGPWQTVGTVKPASPAPVSSVPRPAPVNGLPAGSPSSLRPLAAPTSLAAKLSSQNVKASSVVSPVSLTRSASNLNARGPVSGSSAKEDDNAFPASADLLKWCKEALTGLDIPIDDFVQMLLSFPVPLDKSTRELISDSVYASSRTLDGRHFSDAFADKRLADTKAIKLGKAAPVSAASFLSNITSVPSSRGSMADAIKFIPAQKQPELNFKVVTKTKGKRK